ncbi:MAG: 50S ribosomal protein L29 [Elusimicrobia bacterium]|nr:50S ribosomal protein L29 [Elusimicrobiota bacterium]
MKANDRQAKKNLSVAELGAELHQAQEKAFRLGFKHQVTPLANPVELRSLRRHIARLKTWIQEKQEKR